MIRRFLAWALVACTVASPIASVGPLPPAHPRTPPFIHTSLTPVPGYQLGAMAALAGRQFMMISQIAVSVGGAVGTGNHVMSASNDNSTTVRTVSKENLAGIPDKYTTDIPAGDQDALDLTMFDIIQGGQFTDIRD